MSGDTEKSVKGVTDVTMEERIQIDNCRKVNKRTFYLTVEEVFLKGLGKTTYIRPDGILGHR